MIARSAILALIGLVAGLAGCVKVFAIAPGHLLILPRFSGPPCQLFGAGEECLMSVQRRNVPGSFKREAVDRVANSGLTPGTVARELGLHETVLCVDG